MNTPKLNSKCAFAGKFYLLHIKTTAGMTIYLSWAK